MTIDKIIESVAVRKDKDIRYSYNSIILDIMRLRNSNKLSQSELASRSGISHTSVSRIENFLMQPTLKVVLQILNVFGMSLAVVPKNSIEQNHPKLTVIDYSGEKEIEQPEKTITKVTYNETISFIKKRIGFKTTVYKDYSTFVEEMLKCYCDFLEEKKVNSTVKRNVNRFGRYIQLVLMEYYNGQHNLAYSLFKEAIESCIDVNAFIREIPNNILFYRCRKKQKENYTKSEIFHIPFEKRYYVSTQRYSFPGLPCLYLGASKEICKDEITDEKQKMVTATIKYSSNKEKHKILDLTALFTEQIKDLSYTCDDEWLKNISLFLVCSAYIDYQGEDVFFKQEYIIPQLLLEYIINETLLKEQMVLGIKYFSVKTNIWNDVLNKNYAELQKKCNYVFPAREIKKEGCCETLKKVFEIVEIQVD